MSTPVILLFIVCFAAMIVGALHIGFQLFKIIVLDSEARRLKHPKLWGLLSASGNNSSGLIMYFIARRKYPIVDMSMETHREIEARKKRAGVGIVFLALGAIGVVIAISLM
ncbi:MAG TPA: hypothetical protein H9667_05690 [Firmicutes bacterium]|nr:hypothetical protein [Bacillota bacterium]